MLIGQKLGLWRICGDAFEKSKKEA